MHDVTWLRTLVVVALALAGGGVFTVMRLHWRAWRRLPRDAGLTPLHVALVSAGVLIWGVTLAWALLDSLTQPATTVVTVRLILYGVGAVVILAALLVVGSVQRRRVQVEAPRTQITVVEVDQVSVADVPTSVRRPAP